MGANFVIMTVRFVFTVEMRSMLHIISKKARAATRNRNVLVCRRGLWGVSLVTAMVMGLAACQQTVSRTETPGTNFSHTDYRLIKGKVHVDKTYKWPLDVFVKLADSGGKLELCAFAVVGKHKDVHPPGIVSKADRIMNAQFIYVGSRQVSHGGFIPVFASMADIEARCVMTEVAYEPGMKHRGVGLGNEVLKSR